jgi:hypothetical protein
MCALTEKFFCHEGMVRRARARCVGTGNRVKDPSVCAWGTGVAGCVVVGGGSARAQGRLLGGVGAWDKSFVPSVCRVQLPRSLVAT